MLSLSPIGFLVFAVLLISGFSNATNLTDGLDGLAAGASRWSSARTSSSRTASSTTSACAQAVHGCYDVRDPLDLAIVAAALMGACFGFLWWNASRRKIFMGDTGSLALGGALAGLAIMTKTELLLFVVGGLFVAMTLSVVIQVAFFKATASDESSGWRRCTTTSSSLAGPR